MNRTLLFILILWLTSSVHAQEQVAEQSRPKHQLSLNLFHLMEDNIGYAYYNDLSQVNFVPEAYYRRYWWKGAYTGLHLQVIHSPVETTVGSNLYDLAFPGPSAVKLLLNQYVTVGYEWSHQWKKLRVLGRTELFGGVSQIAVEDRYSEDPYWSHNRYGGLRLGLGAQYAIWDKLSLGFETQWMYNHLGGGAVGYGFGRRLFAPIAEINLNWRW